MKSADSFPSALASWRVSSCIQLFSRNSIIAFDVVVVAPTFGTPVILQTYQEKPDYVRCVSIVASASLREMVKPGALAVISPIVLGVVFRLIGQAAEQALLGAKAVAGMLMFAIVSGILTALFLNTSGGAWDNAKKYIESGAHGGKGSEAHKAAVTGDTVGDPFEDTAGPSLHVLIKMLARITLVMAPLVLDRARLLGQHTFLNR